MSALSVLESGHWIIIGLGNPGERYYRTRHNLGFMMIDLLVKRWGMGSLQRQGKADWAQGTFAGCKIDLLKPLTFMNLSGIAVRKFMESSENMGAKLLVVFDDLNLPLGKLRLRVRGSAGGHHGVESIIEQLQTEEFFRLRLGIGLENPPAGNTADFVLSSFSSNEGETVKEMLQAGIEVIESLLVQGAEKTMSLFNR